MTFFALLDQHHARLRGLRVIKMGDIWVTHLICPEASNQWPNVAEIV